MVKWSKLHKQEDELGEMVEDLSEAQSLAFSIAMEIDFKTFLIIYSKADAEAVVKVKEKYNKVSHIAEYIFKRHGGDEDSLRNFIEVFNDL